MGVYLMITKSKIILALLLSNALVFKLWVDRGDEIATLSLTVKEKEKEISEIWADRAEVMGNLVDANAKTIELEKELNDKEYQLDKMRDRQETVYKKPKLVENMINKSYSGFQQEVLCATSQSDCS